MATDDEVILHLCEQDLHLTVMRDENEGLYIVWQGLEYGKWWDFQDAFATIKYWKLFINSNPRMSQVSSELLQ